MKFKELHEDGRVKETGALIDGVKQGRFVAYEYFEKTEDQVIESKYFLIRIPTYQGVQKKIGFYVDGFANGDYQIFLNNILEEEGTFIDGLAEGEFKTFYLLKQNFFQKVPARLRKRKHSPKVKLQGNYKKGMLHGEQRERFEPDSDTVWISNYREGQPHGITRVISDSGDLRRILTYKKGNRHGVEKEYDEDGRLSELTTWRNGVRHGPYREREVYYDDYAGETDLTLERGMYVNGEKKGKYIKYFGFLPFTPKKRRENTNWERGVHE